MHHVLRVACHVSRITLHVLIRRIVMLKVEHESVWNPIWY